MHMPTLTKELQTKKRGFTLLFAVLVSTLVVAIGATVITIALRQTILSGTSRESQYAFYAANTILECAFYWDIIGVPSQDAPVFPVVGEAGTADEEDVTCAGGSIATGNGFDDDTETDFANSGWTQGNDGVTTFRIEIRDQQEDFSHLYCAEATVTKVVDSGTGVITTTIEAKGYNTCELDSPRAVERGLVQSYES